MTTITNIAQRVLDENNYSGTPSTVNTEYLIKNSVDYINMMAGTSISFTPSGGTQSLTASDSELMVVKTLAALMIRAYLDRGPNVSVSALNVTTVIADPQYRLFTKFVRDGISTLRGRSFERV